jgi:uncharacterized protein (DUF1501 family)
MLTISKRGQGCSRRDFLQIGALGGLALPWLLRNRAQAAAVGRPVTGKSVILLYMHGGPSQYETFDPKMTAPAEIRSATGEIPTSLAGITFGSTFPKLAKLANKLAVVRSYNPGGNSQVPDHTISPIVCRENLQANLGSYYAQVAGLNHPATGIPTNLLLSPRAVFPDAVPLSGPDSHRLGSTGPFSNACAPFMPGFGSDLQKDMQLKIAGERLDDRRALLTQLDALKQELDVSEAMKAMDHYRGQAFDVILRGAAQAFDLSKEQPKTIARYDTAPLLRADSIRKKLGNYQLHVDHARSVGKLLLLARRLCEAGCGFVTVVTNFVWDMHANDNSAGVAEAMPYVGGPFDHAVAALIEDLEARGLDDKVLLVCCGEMGRTPRIYQGGRDHWGRLAPLLFYGGGLKMGQVIGRSAANGGEPASDPIGITNLLATIMHTLFDVGEVRVMRDIAGDVARVITEGEPIGQLLP